MNTVIATAGCGDFRHWAAKLIARCRKIQDVPCLDLSDTADWSGLPHPAWIKARLWDMVPRDVDRIAWLDADVYPLRPMSLEDVSAPFSAMPEPGGLPGCEKLKMPQLPKTYFNAGVFVATRNVRHIFEKMKRKMHDPVQGCFYDQTWFNMLLRGNANPLPTTWNWMIDSDEPPECVVNVHAAGLGGASRWKVLRALYATGGVGC